MKPECNLALYDNQMSDYTSHLTKERVEDNKLTQYLPENCEIQD